MNKIYVRDMIVNKKYLVDGNIKTLTKKELTGLGGSGYQEPYFTLVFNNDTEITKNWDEKYIEVIE